MQGFLAFKTSSESSAQAFQSSTRHCRINNTSSRIIAAVDDEVGPRGKRLASVSIVEA
jgi:hypothetical protein